jgi:hypothetical protein
MYGTNAFHIAYIDKKSTNQQAIYHIYKKYCARLAYLLQLLNAK